MVDQDIPFGRCRIHFKSTVCYVIVLYELNTESSQNHYRGSIKKKQDYNYNKRACTVCCTWSVQQWLMRVCSSVSITLRCQGRQRKLAQGKKTVQQKKLVPRAKKATSRMTAKLLPQNSAVKTSEPDRMLP